MKLSRRTANILLAIGVYMLLTWGTRVFIFLAEFRAGTLVAPGIHFSLVVIGLAIGIYLAYLGIKGRKHAAFRQLFSTLRPVAFACQHFSRPPGEAWRLVSTSASRPVASPRASEQAAGGSSSSCATQRGRNGKS